MIKRTFGVIKRYGISIPWYLFANLLFLHRNKLISKRLNDLDNTVFKIVANNDFWLKICYDNIEENKQIRKGQRRILFYDDTLLKDKDIKYRWEENRRQFLIPLSLSSEKVDRQYAIEFLDKCDFEKDFVDTNAMEVGIALINTITAIQLLNDEKLFENPRLEHYIKNAIIYITGNLEKGLRVSNNHYFFDLIGVLWALKSIVGNAYICGLINYYEEELKKLLRVIINPDGSLFESSTFYHRYVTEALLEYVLTFRLQDDFFYQGILEKMVGFLKFATCDIYLCGIGDNDSGRLLPIHSYFHYSSRDCTSIFNLVKQFKIKPRKLTMASNFGLYKIEHNKWTAFLRCDSLSNEVVRKFIGGHSHNDQLSVCLFYDEEEIFTDQGVYLYISDYDYRRENMTTAHHNTVSINGVEQNVVSSGWKFVPRRAIGTIINVQADYISCCLSYLDIQHRREIHVDADKVWLVDTIIRPEVYESAFAYFLMLPSTEVEILSKNSAKITTRKGMLFLLNTEGLLEVENRYYSENYGVRESSKGLKISFVNKKLTVTIQSCN